MLRLISPFAMRAGGGRDQLELVDRGILDSLYFAQACLRRVKRLRQTSRISSAAALRAAWCRGGAMQGRAPFPAAHNRSARQVPASVKALAQPLAMAVIMRRLGGLGGGIGFLGGHRRRACRAGQLLQSRIAQKARRERSDLLLTISVYGYILAPMGNPNPNCRLTPAVFHILHGPLWSGAAWLRHHATGQIGLAGCRQNGAGNAVRFAGSHDRRPVWLIKGNTQDPRRIYYKLTTLGQATLRAETERLSRLAAVARRQLGTA